MGNEQLSTLSDLSNMLEKIDDINNKSIVFEGDFYRFFVIFGELETQTQSIILFVNNILLVLFKEDLIIFSYLMFSLQESVKKTLF